MAGMSLSLSNCIQAHRDSRKKACPTNKQSLDKFNTTQQQKRMIN